jgi:hypothetical protein
MAELMDRDVAQVSETMPSNANTETPEGPSDSPLGIYTSFPYSAEPFAELSKEAQNALMQLNDISGKTDTAARRLEIEQAWEACHFDRGYQHLLRGKNGGWQLPGQSTGYGAKQQANNNGIYDTNVYGSKGDIIVAALSREVPKQEFFPVDPDFGPDIVAAEEADKFKLIWAQNNNLRALLVDCSRIFWNEDRVLLWTRYELNGQKYGFEEDQAKAPVVPQDESNPPDLEPSTGQEGLDEVIDAETSPQPEQSEGDENDLLGTDVMEDTGVGDTAEESSVKKPLGREITTAHGKLDHKVPIAVDKLCDMQFVQLCFDLDVAIVKATFPWIAKKIKPGTGDANTQLDRIARENVRQAVLGAFVTGDSLARHCTVKYSWFRPSYFMDEVVSDAVRAELFEKFPNGCLLATAGPEYAFSRNESMDKHLAIGHPSSGKGQNRRSMGASLISIQKRINDWVDLLDDFFKRTVPKKWMNSEAFDVEAIKKQTNVPGSIGPFLPQPGLTTAEQYIMVEPTPQPQAALPDFIKWFITALSEEISGALPSLFGAATNTETVGGIAIQRDQALQRVGCPWNNIQDLFAEAAKQAVECAKECRDGKNISQNIPGIGNVAVNISNLAGNVLCYPESDTAFPESWAQRQQKLMTLVDASTTNPAMQQWLFSPANLPALADGIRMKSFKVPGATSVTKQKGEFEILLRSGPDPNPAVLEAKNALEKAHAKMSEMHPEGTPLDPDMQKKMEQGVQAAQQLPPEVSTIPVAQDESELHAIEADVCFQWMNSAEGQKFKNGSAKQRLAYENVHLHWAEHTAMAKKIAAANAPPEKPPSESFSGAIDKMPPNVAIQMLEKMGIKASPTDFAQHAQEQVTQAVQKKAIPQALKEQ